MKRVLNSGHCMRRDISVEILVSDISSYTINCIYVSK